MDEEIGSKKERDKSDHWQTCQKAANNGFKDSQNKIIICEPWQASVYIIGGKGRPEKEKILQTSQEKEWWWWGVEEKKLQTPRRRKRDDGGFWRVSSTLCRRQGVPTTVYPQPARGKWVSDKRGEILKFSYQELEVRAPSRLLCHFGYSNLDFRWIKVLFE